VRSCVTLLQTQACLHSFAIAMMLLVSLAAAAAAVQHVKSHSTAEDARATQFLINVRQCKYYNKNVSQDHRSCCEILGCFLLSKMWPLALQHCSSSLCRKTIPVTASRMLDMTMILNLGKLQATLCISCCLAFVQTSCASLHEGLLCT